MTRMSFPRPVAVIPESRLLFTTLSNAELAAGTAQLPGTLPTSGDVLHGTPTEVVVRRGKMQASHFLHPKTKKSVLLYNVDHLHSYAPFCMDFGPLNISNVYRFCLAIHSLIQAKEFKQYAICLYTSPDPGDKANVSCLLALYTLIVDVRPPWVAYQPFSHLELVHWRDAGRGPSEWGMSIQDVLWGCWRAKELKLLSFEEFSPAEYELYEQPVNGDFNILGPFIAFASPRDEGYGSNPGLGSSKITKGFKNVLQCFRKEDVMLVVRLLNEKYYDKKEFEKLGMKHVELPFEDGSNPSEDIVRRFITMADEVIKDGGKVAVHCKAGLGRTGVLIGAYLIYKYGFSAHEAIGYMRIVRPGMVVGNQAAHIACNASEWTKWAAFDEIKAELRDSVNKTKVVTPRRRGDSKDSEIVTPTRLARSVNEATAHIKTPGQPRKTPAKVRDAERLAEGPLSPVKLGDLHRSRPRNSTGSIEAVAPPTKKRMTSRIPVSPTYKAPSTLGATSSDDFPMGILSPIHSTPTKDSKNSDVNPESPSPSPKRSTRSALPRRGALSFSALAATTPKGLRIGLSPAKVATGGDHGEPDGGRRERVLRGG